MAPKNKIVEEPGQRKKAKGKAKASSSVQPEEVYDKTKFQSKHKAARYSILKQFPIVPERSVRLKEGEYTDFNGEITRRSWRILAEPLDFYDEDLVREFYANAFPEEGETGRVKRSKVRGKWIDYSRDAINDYLGNPLNLPPDKQCTYYRRLGSCTMGFSDWESTQMIVLPDRNNVKSVKGKALNIKKQDMKMLAKIWTTFILSNIAPVKHHSDLRMKYCHLLFVILKESRIDIARVISDEIYATAIRQVKKKGSLGFPALITTLCIRKNVTDIEAVKPIDKAIDAKYIEQNCQEETASTQAPAHPTFDPDAPMTMQQYHLLMQQNLLLNKKMDLLHFGQQLQQSAAYHLVNSHYPGQHIWMDLPTFNSYIKWPEGSPQFQGKAGISGAGVETENEDDDEDEGGDGGDAAGDVYIRDEETEEEHNIF